MKKIFIGIGIITFIGLVISTRPQNKPINNVKVSKNIIAPDLPQDSLEEKYEAPPETKTIKQEHKYYYKGKEITKEEYEAYKKQIEQITAKVNQQIEMLKVIEVVADEYDKSHPKVTYRRYSDGRVETRIDEWPE